jgi:hypothetical protein
MTEDRIAYLSQPQVWKDISSVYEPFIRSQPENAWVRSRYAYYACLGKRWELADRQFKLLGQNAVPVQFGGLEEMKEFQRLARENVEAGGTR